MSEQHGLFILFIYLPHIMLHYTNLDLYVGIRFVTGFVRVMQNLESHRILEFLFPGPEKSWKVVENEVHCTK